MRKIVLERKFMKHTLKCGLLLVGVAVVGLPANVFGYFSYPASRNCADCHDDGRTWQSIHGGGGSPTPTPAPTPTPLPPPTYFNGVVGDGDVSSGNMTAFYAENGFVVVAKRKDGTFTGTLRLQGKALPLKGKFTPPGNATVSVAGNATVNVNLPGKIPVVVALAFDPTVEPGAIAGTVTVATGSPLAFNALPNYTGAKAPAKHALCGKRYTVVLPSDPGSDVGHGYGTVTVAADGTAKFAGKLADGTAFTSTSRTVSGNDLTWVVPVEVPLYPKLGGMIVGELQIPKAEPADAADVVGNLGWLRPANAKPNPSKPKPFDAGFLKQTEPAGERYTAPIKGTCFLTGLATDATFTLDAVMRTLPGTWTAKNVASLTKPCTIALVPASGIIKGKVVAEFNMKKVTTPYEGVILAHPIILPGGATAVQGAGFSPTAVGSDPMQLTVP